jgi:hypothetical protein
MDKPAGQTPETRPRQLRDEAKSCGTQPANIRVINRRNTGSAPLGALEDHYSKHRWKNSWQDKLFSLDNCQPYQCPSRNGESRSSSKSANEPLGIGFKPETYG